MVPLPPINLRDVSLDLDLSTRSGVNAGPVWMDGSRWTVSTGGGAATADNRAATAPAGSLESLAAAGGQSVAPWVVAAVLVVVVFALRR